MAERANVTSVEAIEAFRAGLIVYLGKARPTVEEVSAEIMRTRLWLQNDQRTHWEAQVRRRTKELEQAQQALYSAGLSNLRDVSTAEQLAVKKARRGLDEAEAKLKLVKHWNRDFESRVQPMVKQLEKLHTFLSNDMLKAIAHLAQLVKTLDSYAGIVAPSAIAEPARPSAPPAASEPGGVAEEKP